MHKDTVPFCLGALAGAILIAWVGFDALGWKTSSAAEALSKKNSESAVVLAYARICSAQFNAAKDLPARLAELQKVDQWSRGAVIAKTGYGSMLGEKEPTSGVPQACADLLIPPKS
ncbi:MAG: hypothetical protein EXR29_03060 [Betaproteobacteria bacterium]|nr:hypothetical protein [Betaproteobacteria bacterium]